MVKIMVCTSLKSINRKGSWLNENAKKYLQEKRRSLGSAGILKDMIQTEKSGTALSTQKHIMK